MYVDVEIVIFYFYHISHAPPPLTTLKFVDGLPVKFLTEKQRLCGQKTQVNNSHWW